MNKNQISRYLNTFFIIFSLGFLSGLPASLFTTSLQAWFAQAGYSILFVSSLSLLKLPILLRFIWAPFVDKYYLKAWGRRKTWMIFIQLILFVVIEMMAMFEPQQSKYALLVLSGIVVLASCIQDIVIDAHRIEFLPPRFYGYGAVCAIYAYRIALLVSGGLALILAQSIGFQPTYALIGLFFVLGCVLVFFSQEPQMNLDSKLVSKHPMRDFFRQNQLYALVGLVMCMKFGEVFVSNTSPMIIPFMLQGLGLSLVKIAYVNKIFGLFSQLLGSALAAIFISRISLFRLLMIFGVMQILSNLIFLWISKHNIVELYLWLGVAFENLATGLASTTLVAFLMTIVDKRYTAIHYSIWITIAMLPSLLAGPMGGYISEFFGWPVLFLVSSVLSSCFLFFWWQLKCRSQLREPEKVVSEGMGSS
jgi:PAT family beta-lactamase induction signal transducer AmpG